MSQTNMSQNNKSQNNNFAALANEKVEKELDAVKELTKDPLEQNVYLNHMVKRAETECIELRSKLEDAEGVHKRRLSGLRSTIVTLRAELSILKQERRVQAEKQASEQQDSLIAQAKEVGRTQGAEDGKGELQRTYHKLQEQQENAFLKNELQKARRAWQQLHNKHVGLCDVAKRMQHSGYSIQVELEATKWELANIRSAFNTQQELAFYQNQANFHPPLPILQQQPSFPHIQGPDAASSSGNKRPLADEGIPQTGNEDNKRRKSNPPDVFNHPAPNAGPDFSLPTPAPADNLFQAHDNMQNTQQVYPANVQFSPNSGNIIPAGPMAPAQNFETFNKGMQNTQTPLHGDPTLAGPAVYTPLDGGPSLAGPAVDTPLDINPSLIGSDEFMGFQMIGEDGQEHPNDDGIDWLG